MSTNQYVASFTSQILPTIFKTPYELIILIFQARSQISKLNNLKDSNILTILRSFDSIGSVYNGVGFKFYSNFIFMLSNVIVVQYFELNKINEFETPFLVRYSKFVTCMIFKVFLAWSLGYFLNIVWMWHVVNLKSKKNNNKIKTILKLFIENRVEIFKLFLINLGYNIAYITSEFSCDTIIYRVLEESTTNKTTQSILLKNGIILVCEFLTWPIKTIFSRYSISILLQRSKNSKSHKSSINELFKSTYSGFSIFLLVQVINVVVTLLSVVNKHRK